MKKLLLLLAAGFTISSAMAQDVSRAQHFNPGVNSKITDIKNHPVVCPPSMVENRRNTQRRTTASNGAWFDYFDANYTTTYVLYYFESYPDSNLLNPANVSATNDGYIWSHGMGMSFDPVDNGYYTPAGVTSGVITNADPFNIDSILIVDKYIMNDPTATNDSMIIDLLVVDGAGTSSGTFKIHWNDPTPPSTYTFVAADDTPRSANATYNPSNATSGSKNDCYDSIKVMDGCHVSKMRIAIHLDATTVADTNTNGFHNTLIALDSLYVPAGDKVVMYAHFKPTTNYARGTHVATANYMHFFAGDPNGSFPVQSAGSYQIGLITQNQNAYGYNVFSGHDLLFNSFDFINPASPPASSAPFGLEVPYMMFHCLWTGATCPTTKVNNVPNTIAAVDAYPNPANDAVTVSFNLATATNVSVSLTNMMGQVIATQNVNNTSNGKVEFSTSTLPAGVYFYTVNANGQRTTGRVAVAH